MDTELLRGNWSQGAAVPHIGAIEAQHPNIPRRSELIMISDTPETDALLNAIPFVIGPHISPITDHARKLERERDGARAQSAAMDKALAAVATAKCPASEYAAHPAVLAICRRIEAAEHERDDARAELSNLRAQLADIRAAMSLAEHPCGDEDHCACVPRLQREIFELRRELSAARNTDKHNQRTNQ